MRTIRPEKQAIFGEMRQCVESSKYMILVGYRGMKVDHLSEFRRRMQDMHSRVTVVRNAFMGKLTDEMGVSGMDAFLTGPTAMVTGQGDVVQVSKQICNYAGEQALLVIKGGLLDGSLLVAQDIVDMSKLPSRHQMLGMVVGGIAAPLSGLVGVMRQKVCSVLYALKAIEAKKSA